MAGSPSPAAETDVLPTSPWCMYRMVVVAWIGNDDPVFYSGTDRYRAPIFVIVTMDIGTVADFCQRDDVVYFYSIL
jgi:hypothetical protein